MAFSFSEISSLVAEICKGGGGSGEFFWGGGLLLHLHPLLLSTPHSPKSCPWARVDLACESFASVE